MRKVFILLSLMIALASSVVVKERIGAQYVCERPSITAHFNKCMDDSDSACGLSTYWKCSGYQWTDMV